MSPYHFDQMSRRSKVSRVALCTSKVKVPSVTHWLSQWQGHLLSCFGQLKIGFPNVTVFLNLLYSLNVRVEDDIGVTSLAPVGQIRSREAAHPKSGLRQVRIFLSNLTNQPKTKLTSDHCMFFPCFARPRDLVLFWIKYDSVSAQESNSESGRLVGTSLDCLTSIVENLRQG